MNSQGYIEIQFCLIIFFHYPHFPMNFLERSEKDTFKHSSPKTDISGSQKSSPSLPAFLLFRQL